MSVFNDDGYALDLNVVFIFFMMPNLIFILLTSVTLYLLHLSKRHVRLHRFLGELANCFAKGALDRIVRNILEHVEVKKRQQELETYSMDKRSYRTRKDSHLSQKSIDSSQTQFNVERKRNPNYLLLVPFQMDLLLTVFVYKILSREVYFETCQSYLTTYHERPTQVVCWLKNINQNSSNLSANISLHRYCVNQTITYFNYEHNDVMCTQYVFKSINIIDTITNIFAWHQAIVFLVTQFIMFSHWYQHKVRKSLCWSHLRRYQHRLVMIVFVAPFLIVYFLFFVIILPVNFCFRERRRIDLTRHLLYACSKFIIATVLYSNLYTLHQWSSMSDDKQYPSTADEERQIGGQRPMPSPKGSAKKNYMSPVTSIIHEEILVTSPTGSQNTYI